MLLILQGGSETNGARNLQQLLSNRPDAVNPIIGYNILPATYSLANMTAGRSLDTADTAKSGNSVQGVPERLQVNVTSNSGSTVQVCCMSGLHWHDVVSCMQILHAFVLMQPCVCQPGLAMHSSCRRLASVE